MARASRQQPGQIFRQLLHDARDSGDRNGLLVRMLDAHARNRLLIPSRTASNWTLPVATLVMKKSASISCRSTVLRRQLRSEGSAGRPSASLNARNGELLARSAFKSCAHPAADRDPGPFLHQQFAGIAIGLYETDRRDFVINRTGNRK